MAAQLVACRAVLSSTELVMEDAVRGCVTNTELPGNMDAGVL
jgi:hypothetical protein